MTKLTIEIPESNPRINIGSSDRFMRFNRRVERNTGNIDYTYEVDVPRLNDCGKCGCYCYCNTNAERKRQIILALYYLLGDNVTNIISWKVEPLLNEYQYVIKNCVKFSVTLSDNTNYEYYFDMEDFSEIF